MLYGPPVLDPSSPVRVAGVTRIEESDVAEAFRHLPAAPSLASVVSLGAFAAAGLVSLIVRVALGSGRGFGGWHLSVTLVLTALFIGVVRTRLSRAKRAYAAMQEWQRQVRFEFTDSSLRVRTERSSNDLAWGLYGEWLESPGAFYVKQPGGQFVIIPKRAFENEAEIVQAHELLRTHVQVAGPAKGLRSTRRVLLLWLILIALCVMAYQLLHAR
jgi:hypothetical protein